MKKLILTLLYILLIVSLFSCSEADSNTSMPLSSNNKNDNNDQNASNGPSLFQNDEYDTGGVPLSAIDNDLKSQDEVKNGVIDCAFLPSSSYVVKDLSITKRQTNLVDKSDIVFCNIVIENRYIRTVLDYKMTYGFYDVGGWLLDKVTITSKESTPLAGVDISYFAEFMVNVDKFSNSKGLNNATVGYLDSNRMQDSYYNEDYYSFEFEKFKPTWNELSNTTQKIGYSYSDKYFTLHGYTQFTFDQSYGWVNESPAFSSKKRVMVYFTNVTIDWDSALNGYYAGDKERYSNYKLTISDYSSSNNTAIVDLLAFDRTSQHLFASNTTATIDSSNYSFTILCTEYNADAYSWYSEESKTFYYDWYADLWHEARSTCRFGRLKSSHTSSQQLMGEWILPRENYENKYYELWSFDNNKAGELYIQRMKSNYSRPTIIDTSFGSFTEKNGVIEIIAGSEQPQKYNYSFLYGYLVIEKQGKQVLCIPS